MGFEILRINYSYGRIKELFSLAAAECQRYGLL